MNVSWSTHEPAWRRVIIFPVALLSLIVLSGCELAYKGQARQFVEENVRECGGVVEDIALVQDGASNKLTGIAKVNVDGEIYTTELKVGVGLENSVITMDRDICALSKIKKGLNALETLFK